MLNRSATNAPGHDELQVVDESERPYVWGYPSRI